MQRDYLNIHKPRLKPEDLEWSGDPTIVDIHFDWHDRLEDDTVRVWVVVPDGTDEKHLIWPAVKPLEDAFNDALMKSHPKLVPVIVYRTISEFADQRGKQA